MLLNRLGSATATAVIFSILLLAHVDEPTTTQWLAVAGFFVLILVCGDRRHGSDGGGKSGMVSESLAMAVARRSGAAT